jgi:hypothetical protein
MKFLLASLVVLGVASTAGGLRFVTWVGATASHGATAMTGATHLDLSLVPYLLIGAAVAALVVALRRRN